MDGALGFGATNANTEQRGSAAEKEINESYRRVQLNPKEMAAASTEPILLDHVLNSDHDALLHSAVFSGSHGTLFCVHCASERYAAVLV